AFDLGRANLAGEPSEGTCSGGTDLICVRQSCDSSHPCPSGQTCYLNTGVSMTANLTTGGAPPSMWGWISGFATDLSAKNAFLERVPYASTLTDSLSTTRPAIGWSGGRVWMVAEHNGSYQYRTRDKGFWSGWFPLPALPGGVAPTGGVGMAI